MKNSDSKTFNNFVSKFQLTKEESISEKNDSNSADSSRSNQSINKN